MSMDALIERMEALLGPLQETGDARRFFHATYLRTTRAVGAELAAGTRAKAVRAVTRKLICQVDWRPEGHQSTGERTYWLGVVGVFTVVLLVVVVLVAGVPTCCWDEATKDCGFSDKSLLTSGCCLR